MTKSTCSTVVRDHEPSVRMESLVVFFIMRFSISSFYCCVFFLPQFFFARYMKCHVKRSGLYHDTNRILICCKLHLFCENAYCSKSIFLEIFQRLHVMTRIFDNCQLQIILPVLSLFSLKTALST